MRGTKFQIYKEHEDLKHILTKKNGWKCIAWSKLLHIPHKFWVIKFDQIKGLKTWMDGFGIFTKSKLGMQGEEISSISSEFL